MIAADTFKTAAHCLKRKTPEMLSLICPDGQTFEVSEVFSHPDYKAALDKKQVDVGVIKLKSSYVGEVPAPILNESNLIEFLASENCAIWAYGPNIESLKAVGKFHGVFIKSYSFEKSVVVLKNPTEFIVRAGDSGGGLFCKNIQNKWIDVGSVYGHDFLLSYIVRNDKVVNFLKLHISEQAGEVYKPLYKPLKRKKTEQIRTSQNPIHFGMRYKVKPFSVLSLGDKIKGVGDQTKVFFTPWFEGADFVRGKLEVLDISPLRYLCDENVICRGIFQNVKISNERLIEIDKSREDFSFYAHY